MLFLLTCRLLLPGLLLAAACPAAAQTPEARNLATDTLQPTNAKYHYPVSRMGTVKGQQLYVFITSVSERGTGIEFTWRNPLSLPRPRPVFITSEQLQWVRLAGGYYEPVRLAGKPAHNLGRRLADGPRAELFDVATLKKGVPIPSPTGGVLLWTGLFSEKYNHAYYLRRPGEKTMAPVPEGKKAVPFLAIYFADAPDLAAAVRLGAGSEGYRFDDTPALVVRYNAFPATNAPKP